VCLIIGIVLAQDPAAGQGGPSIHLCYLSGWTRAFVHYNVDGKGVMPGISLADFRSLLLATCECTQDGTDDDGFAELQPVSFAEYCEAVSDCTLAECLSSYALDGASAGGHVLPCHAIPE